ncbi:hypothetical protein U1Q18_024946 [Sarracenia purpurea var. burkii]
MVWRHPSSPLNSGGSRDIQQGRLFHSGFLSSLGSEWRHGLTLMTVRLVVFGFSALVYISARGGEVYTLDEGCSPASVFSLFLCFCWSGLGLRVALFAAGWLVGFWDCSFGVRLWPSFVFSVLVGFGFVRVWLLWLAGVWWAIGAGWCRA